MEALCSFSKECADFFNHGMEMIQDRGSHIWKYTTFRHPESLHTISC